MKYIFFAKLLFFSTALLAQTGNYFLSHYSPNDERFDNVCFDMAQDERGVLYFATKAGVLEFDGRNWELVQANSAIYTLQINAHGTYWGGANGFGKIDFDEEGLQVIKLLSEAKTRDIFNSLSIKNEIYFLNEEAVFILSSSQKEIYIHQIKQSDRFLYRTFRIIWCALCQHGESGSIQNRTKQINPPGSWSSGKD